MEKQTWAVMALLGAVFLGMLALSSVASDDPGTGRADATPAETVSTPPEPVVTASPSASVDTPVPTPTPTPTPTALPDPSAPPTPAAPTATLPGGRTRVFADGRMLVAYYGTAGTGALGVLGETTPDRMVRRLRRAAAPFARPRSKVQPVFELIVTVADAHPGRGRDYNHDIARAHVQRYIDAAHRYGALLLLDIQPGRADFLSVARRWKWALKDPYVGLALDPEWRMGPRGVPGRRIGSVGADEVNRVSHWLKTLVATQDLPEKLFVLHQFRTSMIRDIHLVRPRRGLALVQHVDGFGTPAQKLGTFQAVVRPRLFNLGFKLFYDEDRRLMSPGAVRRIRPRVSFVSYQ